LSKKELKNKGELPKYIVINAHEPIIDKDTFSRVQAERERRKNLRCFATETLEKSVFSGKLRCEACDCYFYRSSGKRASGNVRIWVCSDKKFKKPCPCKVKDIREDVLEAVSAEVLGLMEFHADVFNNKVHEIVAIASQMRTLAYHFNDGRIVMKKWEPMKSAFSVYQDEKDRARGGVK
jgi:hypothetical protein